jgi:hypothetical protein
MSIPRKHVQMNLVLITLLLASHPAFAASGARVVRQAIDGQVNLTVTSTCGPARIRVKKNRVLTTPFTVTFNRGKTIQLKALDTSLPLCGALSVVSPFNRFFANQAVMDQGRRTITLTLDRDTAVLVEYGPTTTAPVTLSLSANCPKGANISMTETAIGGQSGSLRTHFDAHFLPGQALRLEAPRLLAACSDLGNVLLFVNWSAAGKAYPQDQTAIDLTLTGFTSAYAHYTGVFPTFRVNSYQLLHNGVPADYVRVGEDFGEFTFLMSGEPFPAEITVFAIDRQAEIISRASATEIEIRLPAGMAHAPGFSSVRVFTSESRFSNAVPIEIRSE